MENKKLNVSFYCSQSQIHLNQKFHVVEVDVGKQLGPKTGVISRFLGSVALRQSDNGVDPFYLSDEELTAEFPYLACSDVEVALSRLKMEGFIERHRIDNGWSINFTSQTYALSSGWVVEVCVEMATRYGLKEAIVIHALALEQTGVGCISIDYPHRYRLLPLGKFTLEITIRKLLANGILEKRVFTGGPGYRLADYDQFVAPLSERPNPNLIR